MSHLDLELSIVHAGVTVHYATVIVRATKWVGRWAKVDFPDGWRIVRKDR